MQYHCKYQELKDPEILTAHPKNANRHPEKQIDLLSKIINHTGFRHPVIVSKTSGFIVSGHGRALAAKKLGVECPVVYQEFKNEAEEFEFLIADNKIAELSRSSKEIILKGMKELNLVDHELLGLDKILVPRVEKVELGDKSGENAKKMTKCPSCSHEF